MVDLNKKPLLNMKHGLSTSIKNPNEMISFAEESMGFLFSVLMFSDFLACLISVLNFYFSTFSYSVGRSVGRSDSQLVSRLVSLSVSQLVSRSVGQSGQSVARTVSQSVGQLIGRSVSRSNIWSVGHQSVILASLSARQSASWPVSQLVG